VDIPDGRDEAELWAIFGAVAAEVAPEDRVIFDITHGFRSLPFLSFLAAAYLRSVKNVRLEAVLYGALEAGDRSVQPARAPVFDLTRFVSLLDWLTAADRFVRTGDACDLSALLRDPKAAPVHLAAAAGDQEAREMAGLLRLAAAALDDVSLPLQLVRPAEMMGAASNLDAALTAAQSGFEKWARPFAVIADQARAAYAPFGLDDPLAAANLPVFLERQRDLVGWYVERRQYVSAIMLAREWVISYAIHVLGWDLIADRDLTEKLLSTEGMLRRSNRGLPLDATVREMLDGAIQLWDRLPDLRNDIAHVGMRARPRPVKSIIGVACGLPEALARFPLEARG
jgi:CRISPR-associated DxTHG motif protein